MNQLNVQSVLTETATGTLRPRLGFLGVGWIGRHRMEAIARNGAAEIVAFTEPVSEMAAQAKEIAPGAALISSFDELLDAEIEGLVIATPSALHAEQSIAALKRGIAVFCQKPLARNAAEARWVVEAARAADRLLAVDLSYRFIEGVKQLYDLVRAGELGHIFAAHLVFHNAYGPDKPWFYDPRLSGGGCVIDLGTHLVDLALWVLNYPQVRSVSGRLFAGGRALTNSSEQVEYYATALLDLEGGRVAQLACSWRLHAGCDALIEATFYGTQGGARLRNVAGSFYNFVVERFKGNSRQVLGTTENEEQWAWGGRAAVEWAKRLAASNRFDPAVEKVVDVAAVLDAIYGRHE